MEDNYIRVMKIHCVELWHAQRTDVKSVAEEKKKKAATDITANQSLNIKLLKMEKWNMFECTGVLVKPRKGHVNESSGHANSICSLSEEHQSLAGIKMRLFKLQQPFSCCTAPPHLTVQTSAPEKHRLPTWLSSNWALCFKAMEITEEKRENRIYIMQRGEGQRGTFPHLCGVEGIHTHRTSILWHLCWHRYFETRSGSISSPGIKSSIYSHI